MFVLSGRDDTLTKFYIGDCVFVQDNKTYNILEGTATISLTTLNKHYTVTLVDDSLVHNVNPSDLYSANEVLSAGYRRYH